MSNSYTNIFGGITIYPSEIGYISYIFTQSTTLVWPDLGETSSSVAASFLRITASGSGIVVTTPDADKASVGKALRFKNVGSTAFNIASASGSTLATISAGQDTLLSIVDNTTSGGLWDFTYLGSGTTSANAATLAGNGLTVSGATLVANWPVVFTGSNGYQITTTADATVLTWTGGTGAVTFPFASILTNGFITAVKNNGTGALTISGGTFGLIDDSPSVTLQPSDSTFIVKSSALSGAAAKMYTLGLTNNDQAFSTLQVQFSSASTITLTAGQAANKIFILTGQVTSGNPILILPAISGEFIIINQMTNQGTGVGNNNGFVQIQSSGGGTSVNVPLGASRVIASDATNIYFADDLSQSRPAQNFLYWADFSKNPWQRGTSFTSSASASYTADRVSTLSPSGSPYTLTRMASSATGCQYDLRIQRISGSPTGSGSIYVGFDLALEESIPLRGRNATLAAQISYGPSFVPAGSRFSVYTSTGSNQKIVSNVTATSVTNFTLAMVTPTDNSNSTAVHTLIINPPSYAGSSTLTTALSQVSVLFSYVPTTTADANDYINISRLSFAPGTFSSFDDLNAVDVAARCLNHCYVYTASAVNNAVAAGGAISSNGAFIPVSFPVPMRTAPSLTVTANNFQVTTSTGSPATCTSIAINTSGATQYGANLLVGTTTALLAAGNATILQAATATSRAIFSADI